MHRVPFVKYVSFHPIRHGQPKSNCFHWLASRNRQNPAAAVSPVHTAETGVPTTARSGDLGLSAADGAGDNGGDSGDGARDSGLQEEPAKDGVDARTKPKPVADGSADNGGSSGDGAREPGSHVTPTKSGVEARATAKADAKARLR